MMSCKEACRHKRNGVRQSCHQQVAGGRVSGSEECALRGLSYRQAMFEWPNKQKVWPAD